MKRKKKGDIIDRLQMMTMAHLLQEVLYLKKCKPRGWYLRCKKLFAEIEKLRDPFRGPPNWMDNE